MEFGLSPRISDRRAMLIALSTLLKGGVNMAETTISAFDARRKFGKVLDTVAANENNVIVERLGEPVAVIVPIASFRNWKRQRNEAFERLHRFFEETSARDNLTPEEADELVSEAVAEVRAARRAAAYESADRA